MIYMKKKIPKNRDRETITGPSIYNLSPWKKLMFLSMPFLFCFFLAEFAFRITGYQPLIIQPYTPHNPESYFWISDQKLGFRNRSNGSYYYEAIKGAPLVTTDRYGYRNGFGWHPDQKTPIVVFIGDSTMFCAEVNDNQTIVSEIAKLLSREFNVRVLNTGVRGYNTVQAKRMLEECLERFPTIKVAVYLYCGNDYYHNLNPLIYHSAQSPAVWWDKTKSKLLEIENSNPPVPWGEGLFVPNRILQPGLRLQFTNFLRAHSVFLHQIGLRMRKIMSPKPVTAMNLPDVADKITLPQGSIGPVDWRVSQEIATQITWAKQNSADEALEELLRQINQMCIRKNVIFLTTTFTTGKEKDTPNDFSIRSARAGVRFITIEEAFTDSPLSYMAPRSDGDYDAHYGPKGTRTFAKASFP